MMLWTSVDNFPKGSYGSVLLKRPSGVLDYVPTDGVDVGWRKASDMVAFSTTAVGESLRDQRAASGLTLGQAAGYCSIPLTYLLKIEAGSSGPTAEVVHQLVRVYGAGQESAAIEGDQRRPRRDECEIDWVGLVNTAGSRSNLELLEEVARGIRALRSFGEETPVMMREVEADILISMLDLSDPHLLVDIMKSFSLSAVQVDEFLAASVRRFERRSLPTDGVIVDRLSSPPPEFSY